MGYVPPPPPGIVILYDPDVAVFCGPRGHEFVAGETQDTLRCRLCDARLADLALGQVRWPYHSLFQARCPGQTPAVPAPAPNANGREVIPTDP